MTPALIKKFCPQGRSDLLAAIADNWHEAEAIGITTSLRVSHFFAQIATETGGLRAIEENLNYSAKRLMQVWPNRFPTLAIAQRYANNPQALANKTYGGRLGNGPEKSNDGWTYRGSGFLQTTGKDNFTKAGYGKNPDALREPGPGFLAALTYWKSINGNAYADKDDLTGLRKAINGGNNGLSEARNYLAKAKTVFTAAALGAPEADPLPPLPRDKPVVQVAPEPPVVAPEPVEPTPDPVVDPAPPTPVVPVDMMAVEQRLKALGYDIDADGILDPKTKLGIVSFKLKWNTDNPDHALPLDDTITPDVAQALLSTPLPVARTEATSKDLRAEGSTIATSTFRLKNMGKWLVGAGGTAVIGPQAADQLEGGKKLLSSVTEFVTSIPPIVWIAAVVAIGAFIWVDARKAEKARVDMRRKGEIA